MLMASYDESRMPMPRLSSESLVKYRGYRVIHRAGCGAQPTHPRPALWITRMGSSGFRRGFEFDAYWHAKP